MRWRRLPSAQAVARAADARKLAKKHARWHAKHGELIARAVKAFGFNTTLAPVVDLALPEAAEVHGIAHALARMPRT